MVVLNKVLNEAVYEEGGVDDCRTNDVEIYVRCGSSILILTLLLSSCGGKDPNRASNDACTRDDQ